MVTRGIPGGDVPEWSWIAIDNGEGTGAGLQECQWMTREFGYKW